MRHVFSLVAVVCLSTGCATIVEGHEKALFYSAKTGMDPAPQPPGWYWHAPWNNYLKYDMRWSSHKEEIHIHSKDGLHMNIDVVVVVRPNPDELFALFSDGGPEFYDMLVKPAVFAAARDASARFNHLEIATQTHQVEEAIRGAMLEHLKGQHIELSEVAIQHFDLPQEVEVAANRKAASSMLLAAKDVDLHLAESDAQIDQARRRGAVESAGLERKLRAEQDLQQATLDLQIEETRRKANKVKVESEVEAVTMRAEGEAQATRARASAEKTRVITPALLRLEALEALGKAVSGSNTKMYVMPVGKNGMPSFWSPFMNPYGSEMNEMMGGGDRPEK